MIKPYGIHWFRRDLRVGGNPALQSQWKVYEGRVLGLFCFDRAFLSRDDFSANRFAFFLDTLVALRKDLRARGSDILVLDVGPQEAFEKVFHVLDDKKIPLPSTVSFSRDYEPFARKRDEKMVKVLEDKSIEVESHRDHLLIEPHELTKDSGEGYQVYSPFARKWLGIYQGGLGAERVKPKKLGLDFEHNKPDAKLFSLTWRKLFGSDTGLEDHLDRYKMENANKVSLDIPNAGQAEALAALDRFRSHVDDYAEKRDLPAVSGTSRLSIFLKNGSLTIAQIIAALDLMPYKKKSSGRDVYFSELIWREFYYHILYRHPAVESESFLTKYRHLPWENRQDWFEAWKTGQTGFPIVDAGMRELNATGWMHNRVRMIVASFLTKDLLIDWRWGEKYFMERLLDGDLAANNGGWQWAASTGCDPQPYFRIFNPWSQSKKFDPEGIYIRAYLPELSDIPAKALHAPILDHPSYPTPICDHAEQRVKALEMYKALK